MEEKRGIEREGIRAQLRAQLVEILQENRHMEDEELLCQIDQVIRQKGKEQYLSLKERIWLRGSLYDSFRRYFTGAFG